MWNVVPAPCFALGRGLTSLTNIVLDATGTHLTGIAPDGTKIEAVLDENHSYAAKEIIRKDRNGERFVSRWLLDGFRDFGNGVHIATKSTYKVHRNNKTEVHKKIAIQKASFGKPSEEMLSYDWHRPGLQINDFRLGNSAGAIFKSDDLPANITPAELLDMTRKQVAEQANLRKLARQSDLAVARSRMYRYASITLMLVALVLVITAIKKLR